MISWNGAAENMIFVTGHQNMKNGKRNYLSQEEAEALYELLGKTLKK